MTAAQIATLAITSPELADAARQLASSQPWTPASHPMGLNR